MHVKKFLFRVAFANVTSLRERAYMVSGWRAIIAKYEVCRRLIATGQLRSAGVAQCNIVRSGRTLQRHRVDSPRADADNSCRVSAVNAVGVSKVLCRTMMSMGLVCLFFIPNIAALCVAVASIASIASGVCGFLYWCVQEPCSRIGKQQADA